MRAKLQGLRLLVVEDSLFLADLMRKSLERWGCEVLGPCPSVRAAMHLLSTQELDGAILDINLGGGKTTFPVADALRKKGLPFIFITGYNIFLTDRDDPAVVLPEYRSAPILVKPFDLKQFKRFLLNYFSVEK